MTSNRNILDQFRHAIRNPLAIALAVPPAAFLPVAVFVLAHSEVTSEPNPWLRAAKVAIVLGGLTFSAKSVYGWARQMFEDGAKAIGFVVLLEGVMVMSNTQALSYAALVMLVGINSVAAAATVAARDMSLKRRRANRRATKPAPKASPRLKVA